MTKKFCDLCGEPAIEGTPNMEVIQPLPPKGKFGKGAQIRLGVHFSFHFRADGFGGAPDLCSWCRIKIFLNLMAETHRLHTLCKPKH